MPKSRNRAIKKHGVRLAKKQAFDQAARIANLAGQLKNQGELAACLLQEPDTERRRTLYQFMFPFLKFANPEFPSSAIVSAGGLVGPDGRPIVS